MAIAIDETQIRQGDANRAKRDRTMKHIQTEWVPRIILIAMCAVFILPFYWMIALGLKSNEELALYPPTLWPHDPQWGNFKTSTEVFPFWSFARNTLIITVFTILGAVISNPIIAYGFSRIEWPGRDKVFLVVLATVFMPFPVIIVALVDIYAFAVLSAMSRVTSRIRLGTGVTNPYYRHPSLIAASISTLDLLSSGRAFLGLGRGQSEWYAMALGMPVGNPVRAVPEAIDLLRQWWSPGMSASSPDDATEFDVDAWERVIRPLQQHVPVYLAAVGPLALKAAGRHADGVVFNDLASIDFMRNAIATVRSAAAGSGRDPGEISFQARTAITITDDPEAFFERRKSTIATIHALPGMERLMQSDRFDTDRIIADVRAAMRTDQILAAGGGFGDLRRGGDLAAAKRAIPNDLMAELAVAGTVDQVRTRLAELEAIGITDVFLAAQGPNVTVESLAALIDQLGS